jgi:ABC-2 type transport system ATP-binding protein
MAEADSFCQRVAIMHLGTVAVIGTPADLKASLNREDATLADVFVSYAGDIPEASGGYREASATRRTARRLG